MRGNLFWAIVQRTDLHMVSAWALGHHFERLGWGVGDVLAARDEVLLRAKGFGPKSLERWRSVVPAPRPKRGEHDPWRQHAEMVSLAGGA